MRYAIIGLGGIGTSVGLAVRQAEPDSSIIGYDRDPDACAGALARDAITQAAPELSECASAELILVATPPRAVGEIFSALAPYLSEASVLTDVASVKAPILAEAQHRLPYPHRFVGGHPIAGTEHHGWQSAQADLFRGAQWVLTPTSATDADALAVVESFVRQVGATPLTMDAEQHDREMALLSHLPHVVAFSLSALQNQCPTALQGGNSWRSATRVAQSDPALWSEIFHLNREALLETLNQFLGELTDIQARLQADDMEAVYQWLVGARRQAP